MLSALNPYRIWLIVVLVSFISFVGYVLVKVLGSRAGIGLTGLVVMAFAGAGFALGRWGWDDTTAKLFFHIIPGFDLGTGDKVPSPGGFFAMFLIAAATSLGVVGAGRIGAGSHRGEPRDTDRHRAKSLAFAPDFDQRDRVAPVEHGGIEIGVIECEHQRQAGLGLAGELHRVEYGPAGVDLDLEFCGAIETP